MRVKVCGITSEADARLALDAGAWALGFILHRPSPRFVEIDDARRIRAALPAGARAIGVFVDWPLAELNAAAARIGLEGVQLHGAEGPAYAAAVEAPLVIKALRVGPTFRLENLEAYAGIPILLDAYLEGVPGGTGERLDWELARRAAREREIILAGGITPENAARAALEVAPWALDVSSGLERSPGVKDPAKVRALFAALRGPPGPSGPAGPP